MKNTIFILTLLAAFTLKAQENISIIPQTGHASGVQKICFSHDDQLLASVGAENELIIWDVILGKQVVSIPLKNIDDIKNICFSPNNKKVYAELDHGNFLQIEVNTTEYTKVSKPSECRANDQMEDVQIKSYLLKRKGKYTKVSINIEYGFTCAAVSKDNDLLVAGSEDTRLYVYQYSNGKKISILENHYSDINDVIFSSDEKMFATASNDRSIILWDAKELKIIKRLYPRAYRNYAVDYNSGHRKIAIGDEIGMVKIINLDLGKFRIEQFRPHNDTIKDLEFSPDGKHLMTGSSDVSASIINLENGEMTRLPYHKNFKLWFDKNNPMSIYEQLLQVRNRESYTYSVNAVSISPSGKLFAYGGCSHGKYLKDYLKVYNIETGKTKSMILYETPTQKITELKFIDESQLISRENNSKIHLWKIGLLSLPIYQKSEPAYMKTVAGLIKENKENAFSIQSEFKNGKHQFEKLHVEANRIADINHNMARIKNITPSDKKEFRLEGHTENITDIEFDTKNDIITTTSQDASIKLWSNSTGELLATLYLIDKDRTVIITPDKYYLTPKGGLEGIGFKYGNKFYPAEQFDLKFNRPDIVLDRLGIVSADLIAIYKKAYQKRLKKMGYTETMLSGDFHLPEVKIMNRDNIPPETGQAIIKLRLQAKDNKYKLDRINVWINNVAIYGKQGINLREENTSEIDRILEIHLANGVNNIQVSVLNQKGAESLKETTEIKYDGSKKKPDLYIVAFGASKYQDERFNLEYAAKDATDLSKLFLSDKKRYNQIHVKVFTNEEVIKSNLKEARTFLEKAGRDDVVVLFVAGHGLLDENLDYYYASYNMDFNDPSGKGIAYDEIEGLLDGLKALKKMLIMDSCHSGEVDKDEVELTENQEVEKGDVSFRSSGVGVRKKEAAGVYNTSELMKEMFTDLRRGTGATVVSSAGGAEFAMESRKWNNGLFTYCLLKGLSTKKADLNKDGEIYLSELKKYVTEMVSELSQGKQVPTSRIENITMDFVIW